MEFEWDEATRQSNVVKHGIDFGAALSLFDGRPVWTARSSYAHEERFLTNRRPPRHRRLDSAGRDDPIDFSKEGT